MGQLMRWWLMLVVLSIPGGASAQLLKVPAECRAQIDARVPGATLVPISEEEASYRRSVKGPHPDTNIVQSDFNADGQRDTAVLLQASRSGESMRYLAVCLGSGQGRGFHLVADPYCGDGITVAPKGRRVYDYQTGTTVRYRTNGVHTYCFEKAGGTYLFENGRVRLVVDSD